MTSLLQKPSIKESVIPNTERDLPDTYHARLGQQLDPSKSKIYEQIDKIQDYATDMEMKVNFSKTKFMLFNPTINYDFVPKCEVQGGEIDTLEEMKLLGLVIRNDLSWKSNTEQMTKRAYNRLWMLKRLKLNGANLEDLTDVYVKQVRSVLEFGAPVWNSNLIKEDVGDIERVQKCFLHLALGNGYSNYHEALQTANLETLEDRRTSICSKFAVKASKHPKHSDWFVPTDPSRPDTRQHKQHFKPPLYRLKRFKKSPIPYLTNVLFLLSGIRLRWISGDKPITMLGGV
jgi:hypothetical protein